MLRKKMAYCGACVVGLTVALSASAQAPVPIEGVLLPPPGTVTVPSSGGLPNRLGLPPTPPPPPAQTVQPAPTRPPAPVVQAVDPLTPLQPVKAERIEGTQKLMVPPRDPMPDFVAAPGTAASFVETPKEPPLGYTGHSSVTPSVESDGNWVPVEDRWRLGFPSWDRYDKNHPPVLDYPFALGNILNPYTQNVLKGDYPIIGQHTFLNITATLHLEIDPQQTPIGTTPFESTTRPHREEFFGSPNLQLQNDFVRLNLDLFHGDTGYKPTDWRILIAPVFDYNQVNVDELAVINPDVRKGTQRERTFFAIEDYFVELKLADLSPYYDFVSARVGSQLFSSDFRGFLFEDTNRAARIFGTLNANRDQFNLIFFRQAEKDTDSGLNTMTDRGQNILIANYYHQDFLVPGYTIQGSMHYNHDPDSFKFDKNNNLVRPDPTGVFQQHTLDIGYAGFAGDGHIGKYNITHQTYFEFGHDTLNPIANKAQDISAWMNAIELSYDRDWARFRTSFFYSTGDHNPNNSHATGFDSIQDAPNFAGTEFSYWGREPIKLFGVNLKQADSLIPDLRSSKIQGQSNSVNPGLLLFNLGVDLDITPKLKMINNVNWMWFDNTASLRQYTFDGNIDYTIGTDISTGFEYRPLLSNNIVMKFSLATLIPGSGFKSLYAEKSTGTVNPLLAGFVEMNFMY